MWLYRLTVTLLHTSTQEQTVIHTHHVFVSVLAVVAGGRRREPVHVHPAAAGSNQRAVQPGVPPGEVGLSGPQLPAESGGAPSGPGSAERAGGGSKPQVTDHTTGEKHELTECVDAHLNSLHLKQR